MEQKKDNSTEQKIIEAAKKVFVKEGMHGARMQDIADEAGINKALLHYYFRSKEKLFSIIFESVFKEITPLIMGIFSSEKSLFDKIRIYVSEHLDFLAKNPYLIGFIIHEINVNPENLERILSSEKKDFSPIYSLIQSEVEKGNIRPIDPLQLMVNMIALCVFPVLAKPMVTGILLKGDNEAYETFMQKRKQQIADFIINSIKK